MSSGSPLRALMIAPTSHPPSTAWVRPPALAEELLARADRQRVERAQVERVPDVERVVADVVVVVERVAAVSASFEPAVLP